MKTKVTVVLTTRGNSNRPHVYVEVMDLSIASENSPNKRWEVNVPTDDPVSENEYKLMLKQLGLSEKFKPKNGHRITCDAEAFCETYSNGKTNHWLEVQVTKSVRRLFSFDKFQEIDINEEGAKFHFDFSLKERNTDNQTVQLEIPKPEDKPAKPETKK